MWETRTACCIVVCHVRDMCGDVCVKMVNVIATFPFYWTHARQGVLLSSITFKHRRTFFGRYAQGFNSVPSVSLRFPYPREFCSKSTSYFAQTAQEIYMASLSLLRATACISVRVPFVIIADFFLRVKGLTFWYF